ncbi:MAG TPA: ATP-binding protein [Polyangiaceae bacterium]|nr:ATP-binding protein [Polyangiaceae bacterium]
MAFGTQGEAATLDTKRFFSEALEMAGVAVFGFDSTGRLAVVNRRGEALTGYNARELLGTDPFRRLFGKRADAIRRRWFAATSAAPVRMDAPIRARGDRERIVRWHVASHLPAGGQSPALVVIGLDGTRSHEPEPQMPEKSATAAVLAAGLAHEIRNPLNGAGLHLSVLERALARLPSVPPAAAEAVVVLRTETRRLSALVTDFLEVASPRPLARSTCDVNEIAREAAAVVERDLDACAITLRLEPWPERVPAEVDAAHIKRALVNLLRNAVDAAGKHGSVVLRVRCTPDRVEIEVEDDGAGIRDPNAPIFDAFYTTKERGTGLGLSIVQRLVSDHGGEVVYKSRPGLTVFTVRLPIAKSGEVA